MVNKLNSTRPPLLPVPASNTEATPKTQGKTQSINVASPADSDALASHPRHAAPLTQFGKENLAAVAKLSLPRIETSHVKPDNSWFSPVSAVNQFNAIKWVKRAQGGASIHYEDRQATLRQSQHYDAPILTVSVFSKLVQKPGQPLNDLALEKADAWVAERQTVQKVATTRIKTDAMALHERIAVAKAKKIADGDTSVDWKAPILVFLRGNSGAGKSSTVRSALPPHLAALDISPRGPHADEDVGALNPDDAKYLLRREDKKADIDTTSQQYAYEGSICTNRVFSDLVEQECNVVFDKRFLQRAHIEVYLERARAINPNYRAIIVDIEAPLQASAEAVLSRPTQGRSPNVPWDAIESGFCEAREHRNDIVALAQQSDKTQYYCFFRPPVDALKAGASITLLASKGPDGHVAVADDAAWHRAQGLTQEEKNDVQTTARTYARRIDALASQVPQS